MLFFQYRYTDRASGIDNIPKIKNVICIRRYNSVILYHRYFINFMGNQVLKSWNRACTSVGSTVGSLPEYVASQSLTESEKREQKKLDAEDKMIRAAIQYLEVVVKSDTQELAGMENKESAEYVEINSRLAENMNILKQKKIRQQIMINDQF